MEEVKHQYQEYVLSKRVHEILELERIQYAKYYEDLGGWEDSDCDLRVAKAYILLGKKNHIKDIYLCENYSENGCGMMPDIESNSICEAIVQGIKTKNEILGIGRVGAFDTENEDADRGSGILLLAKEKKDIILLSFGRDGMRLETVKPEYYDDGSLRRGIYEPLRLVLK